MPPKAIEVDLLPSWTITYTADYHRLPHEYHIFPHTTADHQILSTPAAYHRGLLHITADYRILPQTYYRRLLQTSNEYRSWHGTITDYNKLPQIIAEHHRLPQTTINYCRLLPSTKD